MKAMLNGLGNRFAPFLPGPRIASYRELVGVGEGKVALENLCLNLIEAVPRIASEDLADLRRACERLGVGVKYWGPLVNG
jgi:hypothetical protein